MNGESIRQLRKSRGLQAKFVADKAGLTKQQLSAIEAGKREIEVNEYIALMVAMNYKPGDYLPNSLGDDVAAYLPMLEQLRAMPRSVLPHVQAMLSSLRESYVDLQGGTPTRGSAKENREEIKDPKNDVPSLPI